MKGAAEDIDYGAGRVNALGETPGVDRGCRDDYDYLALRNHRGPSGVPLGGIGAGYFMFAPDGRIHRVALWIWQMTDRKPGIEGRGYEWCPQPAVRASPWRVGVMSGVLQYAPPLTPVKATFQNYNNETAILCDTYHNHFASLAELVAYGVRNRERILAATREWHQPVLDSSYPDWLKIKLINSGSVIYTNTILNKRGDFTVMEGGMQGLAGTMDQRICAHPFVQKFFPELDQSELELFSRSLGSEGQILHFAGHYFLGLADRGGGAPVPENWMLDNTGGWLLLMAKNYQQTGETGPVRRFADVIRKGLAFLESRCFSERFLIPIGPTTYDDFWHPAIFAYTAGMYPVFLKAGAVLARALGDGPLAQRVDLGAESLAARGTDVHDRPCHLVHHGYSGRDGARCAGGENGIRACAREFRAAGLLPRALGHCACGQPEATAQV